MHTDMTPPNNGIEGAFVRLLMQLLPVPEQLGNCEMCHCSELAITREQSKRYDAGLWCLRLSCLLCLPSQVAMVTLLHGVLAFMHALDSPFVAMAKPCYHHDV